MRIPAVLCALLLIASPVAAAGKRITLYLDGARVESEAVAARGYLEVPLPAGMEAGSLRIRPLQGASLSRVEVAPARLERKPDKEFAVLTERKELLADRLKALEVREEIFRAAAKSQSGKAPRKTKTNREPLEDIRKGTEFAIAQLEGVFRVRRKTEQELKAVDARLSVLKGAGNAGGSVARIWLTGKSGKVVVSYLQPGLKWTPSYDFRVGSGGQAEIVLKAALPAIDKEAAVAVVPALLADASAEPSFPAAPEGLVPVASFTTTLDAVKFSPFPQPALSFSFLNGSGRKLPPGDATCYRQGEYLGSNAYSGAAPGEIRDLSFGQRQVAAK